jgi:hypothetical protein
VGFSLYLAERGNGMVNGVAEKGYNLGFFDQPPVKEIQVYMAAKEPVTFKLRLGNIFYIKIRVDATNFAFLELGFQ